RAARDRPVAQPLGLEPQYLPDTTHRHSLGWHRAPLPPWQARGSLCGSTSDRAPPPTGVADLGRNRWPTWVGTGGRLQIGISGRLQIGMGGRLPSESAL